MEATWATVCGYMGFLITAMYTLVMLKNFIIEIIAVIVLLVTIATDLITIFLSSFLRCEDSTALSRALVPGTRHFTYAGSGNFEV